MDMEGETVFRRARADERELLDSMTLEGVRHWGHHETAPEAYADLVESLAREPGPENNPVFVLEENGGVIGFYELRDRGDHIELLRMFLRPDFIGRGYGRRLWDEAVATAGESSDRMLIMSDPAACGFYEAMGATLEKMIDVAPGFALGKYWFDLS